VGVQDHQGNVRWRVRTRVEHGRTQRWEVVSIAGLDGTFTLAGDKLFAVLKRPVPEGDLAAELRAIADRRWPGK
jgi:hypothetical protein